MSAETFPTHLPQEGIKSHPETRPDERQPKPSTLGEVLYRIGDVLEAGREKLDARAATLDKRKIDRDMSKAHEDALQEYSQRDRAGYMDHLAELSTTQADGNASTIEQQQTFAQDRLNRESRKADRAEKLDRAKERVVGFGKSALNFLRKTKRIGAKVALTGLGVGYIGTEAAVRGAVKGARATKESVQTAKEAVQGKAAEVKWRAESAMENRAARREQAEKLKAFNEKEELARQARERTDKAELKEAASFDRSVEISRIRAQLKHRAQIAIARRVQRVIDAKNRGIDRIKAVKDSGVEKADKAREMTKRRAQRIGHSVMTNLAIAHEAGEAFVETIAENKRRLKEEERTFRSR